MIFNPESIYTYFLPMHSLEPSAHSPLIMLWNIPFQLKCNEGASCPRTAMGDKQCCSRLGRVLNRNSIIGVITAIHVHT
jgi:hypothetical protein